MPELIDLPDQAPVTTPPRPGRGILVPEYRPLIISTGPPPRQETEFSRRGIFGFIERKADASNLTDELRHALDSGVDRRLVNLVFDMLSPTQLEKLPSSGGKGIWDSIEKAQIMLSRIGGLAKWLEIARLEVAAIPGFTMLLTDSGSMGAAKRAGAILAKARRPPPLAGKSYEEIVRVLSEMGYRRQETYSDIRGNAATPYGQDVWTSDDQIVIRIKVGGRSLAGRFVRPPHVVKEITDTPHAFAASDIICKITDDNIMIPAGTKFSAKDMQTWFERVSGTRLAPNAWKDPAGSGSADFAALVHLWAEGAHTAIGTVPVVAHS